MFLRRQSVSSSRSQPGKTVVGRILIVDDDRATVEMLQLALSLAGHEVIAVLDPAEALEVVHREAPDVVLLDVMMPGLSGWDVLASLRAPMVERRIPVLFLTAWRRGVDAWSALSAGADGYLGKPADLDLLLSEVDRLLAQGTGVSRG